MDITTIVDYWRDQHRTEDGRWMHPEDQTTFDESDHSFNLDFPVSPYVGDILTAPVIILGANAGYKKRVTDSEFPDDNAIQAYLNRVRDPSSSDWSPMASYYYGVNYGPYLLDGRAAWINACAYRSPQLSKEPKNKKLIPHLPSARFTRKWLLEAVLPMAERGDRLIVAKRFGPWNLPKGFRDRTGVTFDPAPVSMQVTSKPWSEVRKFLGRMSQ